MHSLRRQSFMFRRFLFRSEQARCSYRISKAKTVLGRVLKSVPILDFHA